MVVYCVTELSIRTIKRLLLDSGPGPVCTTQPLTVRAAGEEYNLGSTITYLPSARAEGDPAAEPGPDRTIAVTLFPGDNNDAIRSIQKLSTDELNNLIARARVTKAAAWAGGALFGGRLSSRSHRRHVPAGGFVSRGCSGAPASRSLDRDILAYHKHVSTQSCNRAARPVE